jgi:hypothetical protein
MLEKIEGFKCLGRPTMDDVHCSWRSKFARDMFRAKSILGMTLYQKTSGLIVVIVVYMS